MSSLSAERMQNIYSELTSSISASVKTIRFKQVESFTPVSTQASEPKPIFNSFSLGNYAVSYLEPQALYNLHRAQEKDGEENVKNRQSSQRQVGEDSEQKINIAGNDNGETVGISNFFEELQNRLTVPDAKAVTSIYTQNGGTVPVFENIGSGGFAMGETKYANDIYSFNYRLNNVETDVRIEFMHKYNRNYDYRV